MACFNNKWNHYLYDPRFSIAEHLLSLQAIPEDTCDDIYDLEGNIFFSAELGDVHSDHIVDTTIDNDSNTIVDDDVIRIIFPLSPMIDPKFVPIISFIVITIPNNISLLHCWQGSHIPTNTSITVLLL